MSQKLPWNSHDDWYRKRGQVAAGRRSVAGLFQVRFGRLTDSKGLIQVRFRFVQVRSGSLPVRSRFVHSSFQVRFRPSILCFQSLPCFEPLKKRLFILFPSPRPRVGHFDPRSLALEGRLHEHSLSQPGPAVKEKVAAPSPVPIRSGQVGTGSAVP